MRFGLKTWVLILMFAALSFDAAAQRRVSSVIDPRSIEVKLNFYEPPSLPVGGGIQITSPISRKWLTVMISYSTGLSEEEGKAGKKKYRWLEDLNIDIWMIIPGAEGYGRSVLLGGKQILWSVPCDGKRHRALFVVPPLVLERYGNLPKFNRGTAEQIPVYIEFKSKNQEVLSRFLYVPKNMSLDRARRAFQSMIQANVGVFKLPTAILPKDRSPWNLVEVDSFDLPKSMVEGK